jgi:AAA domain
VSDTRTCTPSAPCGRCADCANLATTNGHEAPKLDLLAGLRNGAWLDAQEFPPLRYHVPGIVPEGSNLMVGPPKIGKSWMALSIGLGAAAGGRVLGLTVDARPVLYLALEDGHRRLQDRCRSLLDTDRIPAAFDYLIAVQPGMLVATIETWMARHPGAGPLVILDTLGKVLPPTLQGESAYGRDYRIGSVLKRAMDEQPGAALLTNHHDRKAGSEDFVDRVSGTNGLAGAADTVIVLARQRHESTGTLEVTGRDVAEGSYAVRFDGARGLWMLAGGDLTRAAAKAVQQRASEGLDRRARDVIAYVTDHPEGVRAKQVALELDIDVAQARQYLARAHEGGRLERPDRGLYTPVASVACVALEGDDNPERDTRDTRDTHTGGPSNPGELGPLDPSERF